MVRAKSFRGVKRESGADFTRSRRQGKFSTSELLGIMRSGTEITEGGIGGEYPRVTRAAQFSCAWVHVCVCVCVWLKTHVYHLSIVEKWGRD